MLGVDVDTEVVAGHRDHTVGLEARHNDVEEPQANKDNSGHETASPVDATKLTTNDNAPNNQDDEACARANEEHNDRETEGASRHEVAPIRVVRVARLKHGADDPREAKTEEDVHGIRTGDIADSGVGVLLLLGSGHRGEGVGQGRTERDEGNGGYSRLQADDTAKELGELADDRSRDADEGKRDSEARETTTVVRRRDERVEDLPADESEVPEGVRSFDLLQLALVILLGVEFTGDDELAAPGDLLLVLHLLHGVTVHLFALLLANICDDVDALEVFFRQLCARWGDIRELDAELLVTGYFLLTRRREDRDPDGELRLTGLEDGHVLDVGVLGPCLGGVGVGLV